MADGSIKLVANKTLFKSKDVFKPELNHPFFKCERWYMLFLSTNWDDEMQGGKLYKENSRWVLDLHTEFKNYDGEIDHFFDWITPFVVGRRKKQYVGYWKNENIDYQINLYVERPLIKDKIRKRWKKVQEN